MSAEKVGRRKFLQLGLLAGLGGLSSCVNYSDSPVLIATKQTLPKEWISTLPKPWSFQALDVDGQIDKAPYGGNVLGGADMIALGDGWLKTLPSKSLQAINSGLSFDQLNDQARKFLASVEPDLSSCVLPVGVSPWIMLFRNGDRWITDARESWEVLLDPALAGEVVLPESPRLISSLAQQMSVPHALRLLRLQARTFDDRNGLNWLLSGEARVAVLPLQRCARTLTNDPRLKWAWPRAGAPLNWTLVVRPSSSSEPFPKPWLKETGRMPLLRSLLTVGWIPSLFQKEVLQSIQSKVKGLESIFLTTPEAWERSWSLPPIDLAERKALQKIWEESTP